MHRFLMVLLFLASLMGCASKEEKAQRLLQQEHYADVIAKYPRSSSADQACESLFVRHDFISVLSLCPESRLALGIREQVADSIGREYASRFRETMEFARSIVAKVRETRQWLGGLTPEDMKTVMRKRAMSNWKNKESSETEKAIKETAARWNAIDKYPFDHSYAKMRETLVLAQSSQEHISGASGLICKEVMQTDAMSWFYDAFVHNMMDGDSALDQFTTVAALAEEAIRKDLQSLQDDGARRKLAVHVYADK